MPLGNGWYKDSNKNPQIERLASILSMAKPSHGYTVAEAAPEIVTAPGIYFPAEQGEVIPMQSRQFGGPVEETGLSGMSEYEKNAARTKAGLGPEFATQGLFAKSPITEQKDPKMDLLGSAMKTISGLFTTMFPAFKEDTKSPMFRSDQMQKWQNQRSNVIDMVKAPSSNIYQSGTQGETPGENPTGTKIAPTGEPTPLDRTEQYLRQMTTMFSRQHGGKVFPPTPESEEIEARKRWDVPGYAEEALSKARATLGPNVLSVNPGYERSYYEAHPEEDIEDRTAQNIKPQVDMATSLLEEARRRSQGVGLIGLSPKQAAEARIHAGIEIPQLQKKVSDLAEIPAKARESYMMAESRKKPMTATDKLPTPHLVKNAEGGYDAVYLPTATFPGSVVPVPGIKAPPETKSFEQLVTGDLFKRLGREPTEGEILNELSTRKLQEQRGGIPPLSEGAIKATGIKGEKNEAALEGLTESQKGMVKGLVDYKYPWPGSFAMRDPKWQEIMGRAERYDSSFDAKEYPVRQKVRQDYTSGKSAQNVKSVNTAIRHLDTLSEKAEALKNAGPQIWNAIKNKGLTAIGDKRVSGFLNAATAVQNELATAFKGTATEQEIKQWRYNLSSSQSPQQLKESIDTAIQLLGGRLAELKEGYERGMGGPQKYEYLSKESLRILKGLGREMDQFGLEKSEPKKTRDYGSEYGF